MPDEKKLTESLGAGSESVSAVDLGEVGRGLHGVPVLLAEGIDNLLLTTLTASLGDSLVLADSHSS